MKKTDIVFGMAIIFHISDVDLMVLDPFIYSRRYHSLGKMLGQIGDFVL